MKEITIIYGDFKKEYEGLNGVACIVKYNKKLYEGTIVSNPCKIGDRYRVTIQLNPELVNPNRFRGCTFQATNVDLMIDEASGRSKIVSVEFERVTYNNADKLNQINI